MWIQLLVHGTLLLHLEVRLKHDISFVVLAWYFPPLHSFASFFLYIWPSPFRFSRLLNRFRCCSILGVFLVYLCRPNVSRWDISTLISRRVCIQNDMPREVCSRLMWNLTFACDCLYMLLLVKSLVHHCWLVQWVAAEIESVLEIGSSTSSPGHPVIGSKDSIKLLPMPETFDFDRGLLLAVQAIQVHILRISL